MRNLLGGKGANLAEMANLGLPVPPGFTITTEVCTYYYANGKQLPDGARGAGRRRRSAQVGKHHRQDVRRRDEPAAGLGALRRARLDAGHDGHGPQPRPQRRDRRGAGARSPATARFAYDSYRRFIQCIPTSCSASTTSISRNSSTTTRSSQGYTLDTDLTADDWAELVERYKKRVAGRARQAVPAGPARAALGRDRRGVRLVDEPARHHLSPPARHPGELGHGGQRAGHGVRQHGRDLGDRRRLHPQSVDRREEALRRIPHQRAGRGRRRRHPHAAGDHRGRAQGGRLRQAVDGEGDAGGLRRARRASTTCSRSTTATCRTSSSPSSTASCGCCRRAPASAPPKAALRIAVELANEGLITQGRGGAARRSRCRSTSSCIRPSIRRAAAQGDRDRPAGLAGRGHRRDRVLVRRSRAAEGRRHARSSWCASRRRPRTSTACTPPKAS